jgi:ribonuclease P protein component
VGLPQSHRLKHRQDFQAVYGKGKRYHGSHLILITLENSPQDTPLASRFGLSISKKVSKKAVVRNRLKRQIRAVIRQLLPEIASGWRVIIVIRPSPTECNYERFLRELKQLLVKANIIHGH